MPDQTADIFQCEQCKRIFAWTPELAGKRVACTCGATVSVPEVTAEVTQEKPTAVAIPVSPPPSMHNPPAHALPVQSYTHGFVQYTGNPARPGLLMAVAIVSILLGCLSVLVSGFTAMIWRQAATASAPPRSVMPPLPAVSFQPYSGSVLPAGGFSAPVRAKIMSAVQKKTSLSSQQSRMLDLMLAEDGADVLPNLSADDLQPQEPSGSPAAIVFKTPQSTLTVDPESCTYGPPNQEGSITVTGNIVRRYSTKDNAYLESWNSASMESALNQIRASVPGVSKMQLGFVLNELQDPENHQAVGTMPPNDTLKCDASMGAGNILKVAIKDENYQVLPDGRGLKIDEDHLGLDPATGKPLPSTNASFHPFIAGDVHLMYARYAYCMAVVCLAICLIAGAIVTLIRPWLWAWMHLPFAGLKLTAIAVEIYITLAFIASTSVDTGAARQYNSEGEISELAIMCILQAIYPLALIMLYLLNPRLRRMPQA